MRNENIKEKLNKAKKTENNLNSALKTENGTNMKADIDRKSNALQYFNNLTNAQKEIFKWEMEKEKIRNSYLAYLKYCYPNFIFTKFHILLANICQSVVAKIENGEKVRICLSVPPRHGKSFTITETLPSWFIGRNPDKRCIMTAYNADIAEKFGDKNRQTFRTKGKEIFDLDISDSQDNKTMFDIKNHSGGCLSVGILGGITSNGGQLIIVDDPYKNGEDADNPILRERVYNVFRDSVLTRLEGKGNACIVIHTRWHEEDLIGQLEKTGDWQIVNIPAIWDLDTKDRHLGRSKGQTLCPELGFDTEWAIMTEKAIGKRKWNALYMGKPYVENGEMIKRSYIQTWTKQTLPSTFDSITLSCDLSFGGKKTGNDPCCLTVIGRVGANHYVLKWINKQMSFTETLTAIENLCIQYPTMTKKLIERKANGMATIETLNNSIGGFIPFDPLAKSKVERVQNILPFIEAGNLFMPDSKENPQSEDMIDQMVRFPNVPHDDFIDTISQYLLNYLQKDSGKIKTNSIYADLRNALGGVKL